MTDLDKQIAKAILGESITGEFGPFEPPAPSQEYLAEKAFMEGIVESLAMSMGIPVKCTFGPFPPP